MSVYADNYDKGVLLLPCRGANGGTTVTDYSPVRRAITAGGNAQTSTAQSKYYGSSLLLDGTGDYLTVSDSADFAFGTADVSFSAWVRPTTFAADAELIAQRSTIVDTTSFWIVRQTTAGKIRIYALTAGSLVTDITSTATLTLNAWNHVFFVRSSGVVKVAINGVFGSTDAANLSSSWPDTSAPLYVGVGDNTLGNAYTGNMNDVALWKGVALNTTDFTPYGALTGLISGNCKTSTGSNDVGGKIWAVPELYKAGISETTTDGSGNFSFPILPVTKHSIIRVQQEAGYNDQVLGEMLPGGS